MPPCPVGSCGSSLIMRCGDAFGIEQRLKHPRPVQRMQFIGPAQMDFADEYLRHGVAAIRPFDHPIASVRVSGHVDFVEWNTIAVEQGLGRLAVAAVAGRIDLDSSHVLNHSARLTY